MRPCVGELPNLELPCGELVDQISTCPDDIRVDWQPRPSRGALWCRRLVQKARREDIPQRPNFSGASEIDGGREREIPPITVGAHAIGLRTAEHYLPRW